ncbi:MAG: hypothetical protein AAGG48_28595 [Planctomycetota bacterium]
MSPEDLTSESVVRQQAVSSSGNQMAGNQMVGGNDTSIAWQPSDLVGNKLHLVSEPNQVCLFRFDVDGTVAARVYDLGMVEMFWMIDPDGNLLICDDDDFEDLHSSLRLDAWEGDKALVYNGIKERAEEYFRVIPKPLDVDQLLSDGNTARNDASISPGLGD